MATDDKNDRSEVSLTAGTFFLVQSRVTPISSYCLSDQRTWGSLVLTGEVFPSYSNRNVSREFNKYCLVLGALPHDSLYLVADLIEPVSTVDLYTMLMVWLMSADQLTDFQRDLPQGGQEVNGSPASSCVSCCTNFPCCWLERIAPPWPNKQTSCEPAIPPRTWWQLCSSYP
jgi:hypothetical protein